MKEVHKDLEKELRLKLDCDDKDNTILDYILKKMSDQDSKNFCEHTKKRGGDMYFDNKSSEKNPFGVNVQYSIEEVTTVVYMGETFVGYLYYSVSLMKKFSAAAPEMIEVADKLKQLAAAVKNKEDFISKSILFLGRFFFDSKIGNALPSSAAANNMLDQAMLQPSSQPRVAAQCSSTSLLAQAAPANKAINSSLTNDA